MADDLFDISLLPSIFLDACEHTPPYGGFIVYTVNFGNYDKLQAAPNDPDTTYICFYDGELNLPANWIGIQSPKIDEDHWLISRAFKCLPHILFPNAESTLFVDASFIFKKPARDFIELKCVDPFSAFQHPYNETIEEEISACKRAGKGNYAKLLEFMVSYSDILSRNEYKLVAGGVLYRQQNNKNLEKAMELWYSYLMTGVDRDQVALPVALIKTNQFCHVIDDNLFYNQFLIPKPHTKDGLFFYLKWKFAQIIFRYVIMSKN